MGSGRWEAGGGEGNVFRIVLARVAFGALASACLCSLIPAVDGAAVGAALSRWAALAWDAHANDAYTIYYLLISVVLVVATRTGYARSEAVVFIVGVLVELQRRGWVRVRAVGAE